MKYCSKCGAQLMDEAVICLRCGCAVGPMRSFGARQMQSVQPTDAKMAAKVLMIIRTVLFALIPFVGLVTLAWHLPMTISYCGKIKRGEPISTGFKVCILIFTGLIAGILLLCERDENEEYY